MSRYFTYRSLVAASLVFLFVLFLVILNYKVSLVKKTRSPTQYVYNEHRRSSHRAHRLKQGHGHRQFPIHVPAAAHFFTRIPNMNGLSTQAYKLHDLLSTPKTVRTHESAQSPKPLFVHRPVPSHKPVLVDMPVPSQTPISSPKRVLVPLPTPVKVFTPRTAPTVRPTTIPVPKPHKQPQTSVFLLKTHKTAGSVIQNILLRQAALKNLTVGLSNSGDWSRLCIGRAFSRNCICNRDDMPLDILAHHMIFNKAAVEASLKKDAKFVSIVRDPVQLLVSGYTYFAWDKKIRSFEAFIKAKAHSKRVDSIGVPFRNLMMYVFGLKTTDFDDVERIQAKLNEIKARFDLILINDEKYFNSSLILLKELMGWSIEDVVVLAVNKQLTSKPKPTVTEDLRAAILRSNEADNMLYQKFLSIFKEKVKAFGTARMETEVRDLIAKTEEVKSRCVSGLYTIEEAEWLPSTELTATITSTASGLGKSSENLHNKSDHHFPGTKRGKFSTIGYILTPKGLHDPYCRYLVSPELELTSSFIHRYNDKKGRRACPGGYY